ncbi:MULTISPECIES: hypothetical protein [unclassified Pseudomonas]|uniref:hypothetical protein n=1 Tax=unclassified Pseudomonas TaxID=196821 RepID=UPI002097F9C6|nr:MULTISPECIES: hypothetical protein [unclassified Pseudomonas]MCO7521679.1 hypothetical protein [Pseudomonas sp. 1]MCO7538644.1 hypothetical protein [Pseudomonas sp. VA159-2]
MNEKLGPIVTLTLLTPPIILIATGLALDLYLTKSKNFHEITSSLKRSQCLDTARHTWSEHSRTTKLLIIFQLCGAMAISKISIRKGLLNEKDVAEFPKNIRQIMALSAWLGWISFAWLIIGALAF